MENLLSECNFRLGFLNVNGLMKKLPVQNSDYNNCIYAHSIVNNFIKKHSLDIMIIAEAKLSKSKLNKFKCLYSASYGIKCSLSSTYGRGFVFLYNTSKLKIIKTRFYDKHLCQLYVSI